MGVVTHPPRKTRFRLLVQLYRTGLVTRRVPSERFQASAILLSRASWRDVSSSFLCEKMNRHRITWGEIRCQFIILGEIQCRFIILEEIRKKSGVSSSFLPEKMNQHRISRHRISPLWREKGMSLILTV